MLRAGSRFFVLVLFLLLTSTAVLGKGNLPSARGEAPSGAAPVVRTISGMPLTIRIGDDSSFQIFNAAIPGLGQIFPPDSGTGTADMGWFVRQGSTLFAPDFDSHPGGTATGSIGTYTAFGARTISAVSGSGSAADPFRVTVTGNLPGLSITVSQTVEYVNGNNFFTKRFSLSNGGASSQTLRVFVGGDIYLADSDSGVAFREPNSGSPGGQDCSTPATYTILFIPQTPVDAFSGDDYDEVWDQIGAGQLPSSLSTGCIDNGAALQWNRTLAAGQSITLQASTSFGDIPPIAQFNVSSVLPASGSAGASVPVSLSGFGFQAGTTFSVGPGITVSNLVIVSASSATATLQIAPGATLGPRNVVGTQSGGGLVSTLINGFTVTAGGAPGLAQPPAFIPSNGMWALLLLGLATLLLAGSAIRRG